MEADSIANQLVRSLYFGVEAIPQYDTVKVKTSANMTPLNVKVRVRKKDEAGFMQRGVISIPKFGHRDSTPERIRLVSSDQTIMSFDVLMEADLERSPKPRKNFFGGCLGTQGDDDDSPYVPSSHDKPSVSTSGSGIIDNKVPLSKATYNEMGSSRQIVKKQKYFFGKCKPGGCLDPPYEEDKYSYQPTAQQKTGFPQTNVKLLRHFNEDDVSENETSPDNSKLKVLSNVNNFSEPQNQMECDEYPSIDDEHSGKQNNIKLLKKRKQSSDSSTSSKAKKEEPSSSVLSLHQADSTKIPLDDIESIPIITYPPAMSSNLLNIDNDRNEKNAHRRSSSVSKSKKSFEFTPAYFIPPRKEIGKDTSSNKEKQDTYHNHSSKDKIMPEYYSSRKISIKDDQVIGGDKLLTKTLSKENLSQHSRKSSTFYMDKDIDKETDSKTKILTKQPLYGDISAKSPAKTDANDNNDETQGGINTSDSEKLNKLRNDVPFERIKKPIERGSHERQSSIILKKSPYVVSDKVDIRDKDVIALNKRSLLPVDLTIEQESESNIINKKSAPRTNGIMEGHPTSSVVSMTLGDNFTTVPLETVAPFADSNVTEMLMFDEDSCKIGMDVPYELNNQENVDMSKNAYEIQDIFNPNLVAALKDNKGTIDNFTKSNFKRSSLSGVHILSTDSNDTMSTAYNDIKTNLRENAPLILLDPQSQNVDMNTSHEYFNQVMEQKINNSRHVGSSIITDNITYLNEFALSDDKVQGFDGNIIQIKTEDISKNRPKSSSDTTDNTIYGEVNSHTLDYKIRNEEVPADIQIMKSLENLIQEDGDATDFSSIDHKFNMTIPLDKNSQSIHRVGNKASISNISLHKDSISLNMAFQSFANEKNEKVFKTLDTAANLQDNDNIVIVKTLIRPNSREIRVPVDSEYDMFIQIQKTVSDHSKTTPKVNFDETSTMKSKHLESATSALGFSKEDEGNIVSNKRIGSEKLHDTLSAIYEQELVPLQNVIKGLREDIEVLAGDQILLKDKLLASKKLRSFPAYRRCGCHKK